MAQAIFDLDIWRAAKLLTKRYGADSKLVATQRADQMLDLGDRDGQVVWVRIRRHRGATSAGHREALLRRS